jgi:hypothetical protein
MFHLGQYIPHYRMMRWNELVIGIAAHFTGVSPKVVHAEP